MDRVEACKRLREKSGIDPEIQQRISERAKQLAQLPD